jgi:hypothetical protein
VSEPVTVATGTSTFNVELPLGIVTPVRILARSFEGRGSLGLALMPS